MKPSNILIDAGTGQPYITDFGLAFSTDEPLKKSTAGTPAYMSPEQAAGMPLDHRSDVFSLGVVLFEMLFNERPFTGENAKAVMKSIREDDPPKLDVLDPKVPAVLQRVCDKSLSKSLETAICQLARIGVGFARVSQFAFGRTAVQSSREVRIGRKCR